MWRTSLAQRVMPIIGAFYVLIGIIGFFITGFGNFVQNTGDEAGRGSASTRSTTSCTWRSGRS